MPLHPAIVHFPIVLAVLTPLFGLAFLLADLRRPAFSSRAWLLPLVFHALTFAAGFVALRTGEDEEERVERVVPAHAMEAHEEAGELFVQASGAAALLAFLPLLLRKRTKGARVAALAAALAALAVAGLAYRAGAAGGALVYEHGAAAAYTAPAGGAPAERGR